MKPILPTHIVNGLIQALMDHRAMTALRANEPVIDLYFDEESQAWTACEVGPSPNTTSLSVSDGDPTIAVNSLTQKLRRRKG